MLVVRFDDDETRAIDDLATPVTPLVAYRTGWALRATLVAAMVLLGLILTTAWPQ